MAKAKKPASPAKPAGDKKPISDVAHPGTTAPSDTSKPIINQRPIMKDPMVREEDKATEETAEPLVKKTSEAKIAPPDTDNKATDEKEKEEPPAEPEDKPEDKPADDDAKPETKDKKPSKPDPGAEDAEKEAKDAKLQRLVDDKKYFLPLNAVEHRRSKRVVIFGIVLALLLAVAWADIAVDAGLININGVKPVTHFFSS